MKNLLSPSLTVVLLAAGLISDRDHAALTDGLERLLASFRAGEWTVEATDEDVHSAVERRLIDLVGEPGSACTPVVRATTRSRPTCACGCATRSPSRWPS